MSNLYHTCTDVKKNEAFYYNDNMRKENYKKRNEPRIWLFPTHLKIRRYIEYNYTIFDYCSLNMIFLVRNILLVTQANLIMINNTQKLSFQNFSEAKTHIYMLSKLSRIICIKNGNILVLLWAKFSLFKISKLY